MNDNYILVFDENGSPYLAHSIGSRMASVGKGIRQSVKYIMKIPNAFANGAARYFYTQDEIKAYQREKQANRANREVNRLEKSKNPKKIAQLERAKVSSFVANKRAAEAKSDLEGKPQGRVNSAKSAIKKYSKTTLSDIRKETDKVKKAIDDIGVDEAVRYYANRDPNKVSYEDRNKYKQEYAETKIGKRDFAKQEEQRAKDQKYIKDNRVALDNATNDYERAKKVREEAEKALKSIKKPMYSKEYLSAQANVEKFKMEEYEKELAMKKAQAQFDRSKAGKLEAKYKEEEEIARRDAERINYANTGELSDREKQQVKKVQDQIKNVQAMKASDALSIVKQALATNPSTAVPYYSTKAIVDYISSYFAVPANQAEKLIEKASQTGELDNILKNQETPKRPTSRKKNVTGSAAKIEKGEKVNIDTPVGSGNTSMLASKTEEKKAIREKMDTIFEQRKAMREGELKTAFDNYSAARDKYGKNSKESKAAEKEYVEIGKAYNDLEKQWNQLYVSYTGEEPSFGLTVYEILRDGKVESLNSKNK